jgi:transketolase
MLEDIGMMRMLPGMTVIVPGDAEEAQKAVVAAATTEGPVYLRFGRAATPTFTTPETPFEIGKVMMFWESESPKVAILSTGSLSYQALLAARMLADEGIGSIVLHVPTVKPLDEEMVLDVVKRSGRVVTVEEHQAMGGFGSAVAEFLAEHNPVPMRLLGVQDQFGQSGTPDELLAHYGLDAAHIADAVRAIIE